jgi:hypothetical protein
LKVQEISKYNEFHRELEKTKQIREQLVLAQSDPTLQAQLFRSSKEFMNLVEELDKNEHVQDLSMTHVSTFQKLNKTQLSLNEQTSRFIVERYGVHGVSLDNLE